MTIDEHMITNVLETDVHEAMDLMSVGLFIHIFFLGIIPSVIVYFVEIEYGSFKKDFLIRLSLIINAFLIVAVITFANFKQVSFITRQNNTLNQQVLRFWSVSVKEEREAKLHQVSKTNPHIYNCTLEGRRL